MRRKSAITVFVSMTMVFGVGLNGIGNPASALSSSDIRISALSVNQGKSVGVSISYLYSAKQCVLRLVGPKTSKPRTVKIKNSGIKASLPTTGLPIGQYVVRADCGKGEKASSSPFDVIALGAPTTATCELVESGFSAAADKSTSYGAVLTNKSPSLVAEDVKLSIAFKDASGATLATRADYAPDILPGQNIVLGGNEDVVGVASITIAALCDSTSEPAIATLQGQATTIAARNSSRYPTSIGGQFTNMTGFILSGSSTMKFVTRNVSGQITGGGSTYPDAFVPVGAVGTWSTIIAVFPQNVASVEWIMSPSKA